MAISLPRMCGSSSAGICRISTPLKRIAPPRITPGGIGTRRKIELAVTLLPQPDSPTRPTVRPCSMLKDTPSTACKSPASVRKPTFRSSTSRSATRSLVLLLQGLELLLHAVEVLIGVRVHGIRLVVTLGFFQCRALGRVDPVDEPIDVLLGAFGQVVGRELKIIPVDEAQVR